MYDNEEVNLGNQMTPSQVKNQPKIQWDSLTNDLFTLIMTDPDAPSRAEPKYREWHHFLVGNIHGSDLASGDVLSEYIGAGPPKDSGLHRYVFLLYKQSTHIDFNETKLSNRSSGGRAKFSTYTFAEKYNLGTPIAGNFFQAEYDDYVPLLYKQLSGP